MYICICPCLSTCKIQVHVHTSCTYKYSNHYIVVPYQYVLQFSLKFMRNGILSLADAERFIFTTAEQGRKANLGHYVDLLERFAVALQLDSERCVGIADLETQHGCMLTVKCRCRRMKGYSRLCFFNVFNNWYTQKCVDKFRSS